jgi:hypothetical protein
MLLSDYERWRDYVLEGICLDHDRSRRSIMPGAHCACTGRRRRESWRGIFALPEDVLKWQGILDRIEPEWLTAVLD